MSSDLLGVNPATLNRIFPYYRLMTKWSGLGDSTELSRVGLLQCRRWKLIQKGLRAKILFRLDQWMFLLEGMAK
jgi:hypothetical protein